MRPPPASGPVTRSPWSHRRHRRRALLLVAALVVAAALATPSLAGTIGLTGSDAEAAPPCPTFAFVAARGSGEGQGAGGPLSDLYRTFAAAGGNRSSVRVLDVGYDAVSVPDVVRSGRVGTYWESVDGGVAALRALLARQVYDCPSTRFLLTGYSQGAHVVTRYLETLDPAGRLDRAVAERVTGVALFGSPVFAPADGPVVDQSLAGRGAYDRNRSGVFAPPASARRPSVLSARTWLLRTRSYCLARDAICQNPALPNWITDLRPNGPSSHYRYTEGPTADAGRWLAMRARLPARTPAPLFDVTTTALPPGTAGTPYDATIGLTGGVAPYRWDVAGLPDGLSSRDGRITGTPARDGESTVTVTVRDRAGATVTRTLTLRVDVPGAAPGSLVRITSGSGENHDSRASSISDDGRWGAFVAPTGGCPAGCASVVDTAGDRTTPIPGSDGSASTDVAISGDGSTVAFGGGAVPETSTPPSLHLYDRATGAVTPLAGANGTRIELGDRDRVMLSTDGRYLLFSSRSDVVGDRAGVDPRRQDLWRYDRADRTFQRVSITPDGSADSGGLFESWLSPDGMRVMFRYGGSLPWSRDLATGRTEPAPLSGTEPWSRNGRWAAAVTGTSLSVSDADGGSTEVPLPPQIVPGDCRTEVLPSDDGNRFLIQTCGGQFATGLSSGPLWLFDRTTWRAEPVHPGGFLVRNYYRHAATPDLSRVLLTGRDLPGDPADTNGLLDVYRWAAP